MLPRRAPRTKTCRSACLRRVCLLTAAATLAVSVTACGSPGGGAQGSRASDYRQALAGAPPPLASLYRQANRLLPGGLNAFDARLKGLRGHPVVVNKWASWCGPCREEFPWFQDLSARLGKRVAFLGVNSNDSSAAAKTFLGEFPVPYPSYSDPARRSPGRSTPRSDSLAPPSTTARAGSSIRGRASTRARPRSPRTSGATRGRQRPTRAPAPDHGQKRIIEA